MPIKVKVGRKKFNPTKRGSQFPANFPRDHAAALQKAYNSGRNYSYDGGVLAAWPFAAPDWVTAWWLHFNFGVWTTWLITTGSCWYLDWQRMVIGPRCYRSSAWAPASMSVNHLHLIERAQRVRACVYLCPANVPWWASTPLLITMESTQSFNTLVCLFFAQGQSAAPAKRFGLKC